MERIPSCVSLAACLLLNVASVFSQYASQSPKAHPQARRTATSLPLFFEANQGQSDPRVRFISRGTGYTLFLTPTELTLVEDRTKVGGRQKLALSSEDSTAPPPTPVHMKLVGSNPSPKLTGVDQLPGKVNYLIGNDPRTWHTSVPLYSHVRSEQVYPGVDLVFHGDDRQLEYDFVVSLGADPNRIAFQITGATREELTGDGDLVLLTDDSQFRLHKPVIYQMAGASGSTWTATGTATSSHEDSRHRPCREAMRSFQLLALGHASKPGLAQPPQRRRYNAVRRVHGEIA